MWADTWNDVCRKHPDLVAVLESSHGKLALLLRHSLVPLHHERARWLGDTRHAARAVIRALRAAGLEDSVIVLQWCPLPQIAHILRRWTCRYDGDSARRAELTDIAVARLRDRATSSPWTASSPAPAAGAARDGLVDATLGSGFVHPTLVDWYRNMAPTWLGAEPIVRRQLILRTHRWIVERVLLPTSRGGEPAREDLAVAGSLAQALTGTVPKGEVIRWRAWIRLVIADLTRALSWPAAERNDAWARWLFLIPYSIPLRRKGFAGAVSTTDRGQ